MPLFATVKMGLLDAPLGWEVAEIWWAITGDLQAFDTRDAAPALSLEKPSHDLPSHGQVSCDSDE